MARDVTDALIERYGWHDRLSSITLGAAPTERTIGAMGPLLEIRMRRLGDNVSETWRFQPRPRLCYVKGSRNRLWVLGGGFRFDGDGFHAGGPSGLATRAAPKVNDLLAKQAQLYRRNHNGLDPRELAIGVVEDVPRELIALGHATHVAYQTDRNDGTCATLWGSTKRGAMPEDRVCAAGTWSKDGWSDWEHPFENEGVTRGRNFTLPLLCTGPDGRGLYWHGGTYTVIDGWIAG